MCSEHTIPKTASTAVCRTSPVVYSTLRFPGPMGAATASFRREHLTPKIAGPGKDQTTFWVWFLLKAYHFRAIVKSGNHKSDHHLGPVCKAVRGTTILGHRCTGCPGTLWSCNGGAEWTRQGPLYVPLAENICYLVLYRKIRWFLWNSTLSAYHLWDIWHTHTHTPAYVYTHPGPIVVLLMCLLLVGKYFKRITKHRNRIN